MPQTQNSSIVVIISSRSISLAIAYNIAHQASNSQTRLKITVIELFDEPFAAMPLTCTGCLHYGFPEETQPLLPSGKYSFDLWATQAEKEEV